MITYAILGVVYALVCVVTQLAVAVPWLSAKNIDVDYGSADVLHAIVGVFAVVALFGIVGLGVGALLRNQIVAVVGRDHLPAGAAEHPAGDPGREERLAVHPQRRRRQAILHTTGSTEITTACTCCPPPAASSCCCCGRSSRRSSGAAITMNRDIT